MFIVEGKKRNGTSDGYATLVTGIILTFKVNT
jgi:hypothetical protein